ncbi:MAG: hypothetical protein ACKV2T_34170 [Kofleriaceae bacterium]
MKTTSLAALVFAAATALGGSASAAPTYSRTLDDFTLDRAKEELRSMAQTEGIGEEATELLFKLDVFATSSDTGCPGVDVDVINNTGRTVWNIEVTVTQKDGLVSNRVEKVHLPYMLANTKVRVTTSCISDYKSRYDYSNDPITLNYDAKGTRSLDEALPEMQKIKRDYVAATMGVSPSTVEQTTSLLQDALEMQDEAVAKELVLAIARTGVGRDELGKSVMDYPSGAIADEVVKSLSKLPAAQQSQLARALLGSPASVGWKDKLDPMIDRTLCAGNRADVIGLWMQAQSERGIPVEHYRTKISAKCAPTAKDGPGFVGAIDKSPEMAGALDSLDPALFAQVVGLWKAKPGSAGHLAFLNISRDSARFTDAVGALSPETYGGAVLAVILATDGPSAKTKSDWVAAIGKDVPKEDIDGVVRQAMTMMFDGDVSIPGMRDSIKSYRSLAIATADEVIATAASKSSIVFDPKKVKAAGVDLADFLAFESTLGGDCTSNAGMLAECAKKIAANPAMVKLVKSALKADFESSMRRVAGDTRNADTLVALAKDLRGAGFDVGFVAQNACRDAKNAVAYGGNPDEHIAVAEKIAPDAPCIEEAKDAAGAKARKAIIFSILAIVGLLAPIVVGIWLAKRRWKKVQKELPQDAVVDASGEKIDDRLGAGGLGRMLRDGLAEAKRDLAGTAGGQSLAQIDDPIIFAVQGTVKRAVKTGDAATVIIKRASDAVYIVALPVRDARPQVVQRYLGAPWPEHVAQIQAAAGMPILALVVMCGPDVSESTLLVGWHIGEAASDPDALLDAREARERGANQFRYTASLTAKAA